MICITSIMRSIVIGPYMYASLEDCWHIFSLWQNVCGKTGLMGSMVGLDPIRAAQVAARHIPVGAQTAHTHVRYDNSVG